MKRRRKKTIPSRSKPKSKPKRKKRIRTSEILAIFLLFLALFIFLSLISYDSKDPSWANVTPSHQKTHNYAGKAGASLSEAFLQFLGFGAFLVPLGLIYLCFGAFFPGQRLFQKTAASFLFILVFSALLYLIFKTISWRGTEIQAGGIIGSLISSILVRYFNSTGSVLILFVLLILLFLLSTEISLRKILDQVSRLFSFFFKEIRIKVTRYQKVKRREKMRKKVVEKYSATLGLDKEKKEAKKKKEKKLRKEIKPEPVIVKPPKAPEEKPLFPELEREGDYHFPHFNLLDPGKAKEKIDKDELYEKKQRIEEKLREFRVEGEVKEYHPGPVVTTYEFYPYPGIKVSQVANLSEDLSLALGAESIRIRRIPGKSTSRRRSPQ